LGRKPVGAVEKILLVDGIIVKPPLSARSYLEAGSDRPLFPLLWEYRHVEWLCPILAFFEPLWSWRIFSRVRLVLLVRDAVDPGTGILSQTPECLIQLLACDQVSNRGAAVSDLPWRVQAILLMSVKISFRARVSLCFLSAVRTLASPFLVGSVAAVSGALRFPHFVGTIRVRLLQHPSVLLRSTLVARTLDPFQRRPPGVRGDGSSLRFLGHPCEHALARDPGDVRRDLA